MLQPRFLNSYKTFSFQMLGKMNVLTEKILEINPLVQAGLSFDYVSFQFGLMPYQHGNTHEGIHVSFKEIEEALPTVDYFHPKRSKDWGAMLSQLLRHLRKISSLP